MFGPDSPAALLKSGSSALTPPGLSSYVMESQSAEGHSSTGLEKIVTSGSDQVWEMDRGNVQSSLFCICFLEGLKQMRTQFDFESFNNIWSSHCGLIGSTT